MQKAIFRLVFKGYEIVQIPRNAALRAEELLLPANLCKKNSINPAAFASLAGRMRRIMAPYVEKRKRKVCVSRKGSKRNWAHGRDFANTEAYENTMRELGYDVVAITNLDLESQFALWANTNDIVGIHGAGMMNMIMMPSKGRYIEIVSEEPTPRALALCAMAAGHKVGALICSRDAQGHREVDLDRLKTLLLDAS